jgi:hypothetical protein
MTDKAKNLRGASVTTNKDAGASNTTDAAQGETNSAPLRMGKTYEGTIVNGDNNSMVYTVRKGDRMIEGCHWVAGLNAALIGIKTHLFPTRGTRVTFVYGNPSYIVAGLPSGPRDDVSGNKREMTQTTGGKGRGRLDIPDHSDFGGANKHATAPKDLFEGELDIENHLGVAWLLLNSMAGLKAGERAKIEAFVLNDMVRIVSDCYKNITAFGDMQIYNDGRLNVRFDGTSYEHEAWSLMSEEEPKASVSQFQIPPEEDLVKTGRWRFSQYIGFLGDFVHQFVTEPAATASSIAEGALRPGKSRIQQMSDGSVLIQSVADISIERVCRVQVPIELKRWDDPQGVASKAFKNLQKQYLKLWDYGPGGTNVHHCAYQLREYSRWLSCYHSFARFHQMAAEWRIPLETETSHAWTNQEKDVEQANSSASLLVYDTYACWRIMRDGTIVLWDGYGNGLVMGKSGVQLSSVEHIDIDAAGDVRITSGGDIILKARRNIEISAICGGLILKACTWFKGLCERGVLWLKGDATDPVVDPDTENPRGETGVNFPEVEKLEYAVLIEASQGRVAVRGDRTVNISAEGVPDAAGDQTDVTGSVIIQSRFQDVRLYSQRNALVKSQGGNSGVVALESPRGIVADAPKFLSTAYVFDVRYSAGEDNSALSFKGGKLSVRQVAAKAVGAIDRLAGPERGPTGGNPPPGCCLPTHYNHVDKVDDFDEPEFADSDDLEPRIQYEDDGERNPLMFKVLFDDENPTWAYPEPADYKWPNEAAAEYPRQEPISQQRIRYDAAFEDRVDDWAWNTLDTLQQAPRTDISNLPYPGRSVQELYHPDSAGSPLHTPLEDAYNTQNQQTGLRQRQPSRKYRKRDVS